MENNAKNNPEQAPQRERIDTPETIVRAEIKPDIKSTIKALAEQAYAAYKGKPEEKEKEQKNYENQVSEKILSVARSYFTGTDAEVKQKYWSIITQKTDARLLQIVHHPPPNDTQVTIGTIDLAYLNQNHIDINDKVKDRILYERYLTSKIEKPDETRSQLAEFSRSIKAPPGIKLPPSPYEKDKPDNKDA